MAPVEEGSSAGTGAESISCANGSTPVWGFPEAASGGCVDTEAARQLGCVVDMLPNGFSNCFKRIGDGRLWTVAYSGALDESQWTPCSMDEALRVRHSCPFDECSSPPPSACSVEDTCDQISCGGIQFDENGCQRDSCTSDAECAEAEIYTEAFALSLFCSYRSPDWCQCSGPGILTMRSFCVPTDTATGEAR